jgi:hypothetical protein
VTIIDDDQLVETPAQHHQTENESEKETEDEVSKENSGVIDDDQAAKDARFEIIQMYLQLPGIEVNYMMNVFLTKTLISSAILKQHECYGGGHIISIVKTVHPGWVKINQFQFSSVITAYITRFHVYQEQPWNALFRGCKYSE